MILIAGLGNPGEKYQFTHHNVGFMVVDLLLKELTSLPDSIWKEEKKFSSLIAKVKPDLVLVRPTTFMNSSGLAIKKIMQFYKIPSFGVYIIHDDLDLPLGKIKISAGHGSAGHRGIESIINNIGSNNFVRIRIGIGRNRKLEGEKYVLSEFSENERGKVGRIIKKAVKIMRMVLEEGVEKAANRFN